MTNKKTTKRALFLSAMSLLLCVSMLVGTTYAWFTDEVVSGMNTIVAGNLDIELLVDGEPVTTETTLFDNVENWEPGVVVYENLQVVNKGSLALKYQMSLNFGNENDLDGHKLSEVLQVAVLDRISDTATRQEVLTAAKEAATLGSLQDFIISGELEGGVSADEQTIVIFWEPGDNDTDNLYNVNNGKETSDGKALHIEFGVHLAAYQKTSETDSFGNDYDKASAVFTVDEANALMIANEDAYLIGANEPGKDLEIPAGYTGELILENVRVASVKETTATTYSLRSVTPANIVILGNVVVDATAKDTTGSAISATALNIYGNGTLTAIANGEAAFGIGGMNTQSITINGITIKDVKGGCPQRDFINDTKYGKKEPEGGAAIGSGLDGAEITLNGVTIINAEGGSKAAAIGARYHTGVTININNSTIKNIVGGNASAAIGSSRVSGSATENGTTINIKNSTIEKAQGGQFGAGIGSGYDTHCQSVQPLCTINIENSKVTAFGGKYAAGIGSGYHNAALDGEIKNSTIKATAGEKWYKDTYTYAMDIGFGVTDPEREGAQTDSYLIYNGSKITLANAPQYTKVADGVFRSTDGNTYYITDKASYAWMDAQADNFFGNKTIKLDADIDFGGDVLTPVKFWNSHPTFDGQNHTLSNFVIEHSGKKTGSGLFTGTFHAKNLIVDNATVTGDYAGAISGWMYGNIDNCTVKNSNIICTYWQGGGLAGQYNSGNVTNCTVENTKISGGSAVGALIGILNETAGTRKLVNCTVKNCEIVKENGFGGNYDKMFGVAVGLINVENSTIIFDNCVLEGNKLNGAASELMFGVAESSCAITINGMTYVENAEKMAEAVAAGKTNLYLGAGEYNVANCGGKTLTVNGTKDAVLKIMNEGENGCDYGFDGATVTFNGITINTTENTGNYKGYARLTATFNDCDFFGAYTSYNTQTFNNCHFDFNNGYFWVWGANELNFNECEFGGNSKAILAHGSASTKINVKDCAFAATEKGFTGSGDNTAAIEIDPVGSNTYTITFSGNNTITDSYAGWTRVKDGSTGHVINGLN